MWRFRCRNDASAELFLVLPLLESFEVTEVDDEEAVTGVVTAEVEGGKIGAEVGVVGVVGAEAEALVERQDEEL